MSEICKQCGLPKELCVCETISKETQKINIYKEKKRFGKTMTIIEGIDATEIDCRKLAKKLKSKLACGGTYKDGKIELQGDHVARVLELLKKEGFPESIIEVQ
ncbi:MAG: stress response translation initiation inhibitor YciH [Candidatus Aenigmarchaeota archaeon ex4484_14]|nr:MAG: stress response translation initiation inhibitor YciH [Candidatus Aenigmarchaeota archaeon ex4484_14]